MDSGGPIWKGEGEGEREEEEREGEGEEGKEGEEIGNPA